MSEHAKSISFELNGSKTEMRVETHENLVELLIRMNLNGARESCGQGLCGCCTVIVDDAAVSGCLYPAAFVDGVAVSGCLFLAVRADGTKVTTVEHLDQAGLTAVQQAFIDAGAFQCGFCTPGFVLMTHQLLQRTPDPSDDEIRHYLSGNLCRCAAYPEIIEAVRIAARAMKQSR